MFALLDELDMYVSEFATAVRWAVGAFVFGVVGYAIGGTERDPLMLVGFAFAAMAATLIWARADDATARFAFLSGFVSIIFGALVLTDSTASSMPGLHLAGLWVALGTAWLVISVDLFSDRRFYMGALYRWKWVVLGMILWIWIAFAAIYHKQSMFGDAAIITAPLAAVYFMLNYGDGVGDRINDALKAIAEPWLYRKYGKTNFVFGVSSIVLGAMYQAGHHLIGWHVENYLILVGFMFLVTAMVNSYFSKNVELSLLSWIVAIAMWLLGPEPAGTPELRLRWWWLAVPAGIAVYHLYIDQRSGIDEYGGTLTYYERPLLTRLMYLALFFALFVSPLTCFSLYGLNWSAAAVVFTIEVPLLLLSFALWVHREYELKARGLNALAYAD